MPSNDFLKLAYADVFPFAPGADPKAQPSLDVEFKLATNLGRHSCINHYFQGIQVCFMTAEFASSLEITYEEPRQTFSFCFNFDGSVASLHCGKYNELSKGFYNFFYDPDPSKAHYFNKEYSYDIFHMTVEADTLLALIGQDDLLYEKFSHHISRQTGIPGFKANLPLTAQVKWIIQSIRFCPLKGAARRLFIESKVYELLALQVEVWQKEYDPRTFFEPMRKDAELMHAVREYLQLHFQDDLSLTAICKEFGINECKLKGGFKAMFGKTVFGYIQELRMEFARQLLFQKRISVGLVADKLGYRNANHFSTAFKKYFGESPGNVRS
ncbi:MAG: helix-turn-helix domain-containing protein [Imperialibacter sp.]|uniref:helix-turn-helix domain-containing protein n=1 Tax=Imperialibacter sp. TaxID=2038411 RepID=UPI003A8472E2